MLHLVQEAHTALKNKAFDKAAEKAHKAIKSDPLSSSAWHILGLVALEQKKFQEAVGYLQKAIQAEPKALYYFNLGIAYKRLNLLEDSIKSYLQCLKMDPKMIRALSNLANVYRANQQFDKALECYQRTIDLDPTNAVAFYNLGILYQSKEAFDEAIKAYSKAIKLNPTNAKAFGNLATIYSKLRRYEKSIQFYERALKIDRNFFDAYNNYGGTLIELGKLPEAETQLRKALQLEPTSCPTLRNLTLCKQYTNPQDKDAKTILKLLKNPKLTNEEVTHLHFALGKIYHDCLLYDKAFFHYQKGNELHFAKFPFNIFSLQDYTRDIVQLFDESIAVAQKNLAQSKIQPLIILGLPRSGKSVLENILKFHPDLSGAGEVGLAEFVSRWEKEQNEAFPHIIKKLDAKKAQELVDLYEHKILRDLTPQKYLMDTMPGNVFYLGLFFMLFPNAKVISMKRDRNDLGLFIYFKYFVNRHYYTYHLKTIGQYYKLYQYLMRHWIHLYRDKILEVRYEDLILHPESTLERIAQFLKIESNAFPPQKPLSSHEIGQSNNFKEHLEPLQQGFQFDPQNDAIRLQEALKEATEKHKSKKYEEAAKLYRYILQYDPHNPVPIHLLGVLAHEMGHDERAIALIKKAIEMNPNYAQAHNNLGVILLKNKRQIEAENHFKIAETITEAANTEKFKVLTPEHYLVLQDAFLKDYQKIKEHERKVLYKGDVKPTTTSFMTKSWDYYFKDLSYGSYRLGGTQENTIWRMRTWHFLFKNLAIIERIFSCPKEELKILDVGCSSGFFRRFIEGNVTPFETKKLYYWGLDIRQEMLEKAISANTHIESGAAGNYSPSAFIIHDIEYGLPYKDNFFDIIINFEMIKYLPLKLGVQLIYEMYRVLRPEGKLFLSTSYDPSRKDFMQSMPFNQLKDIFHNRGFVLEGEFGGQARADDLMKVIKKGHRPLYNALCRYHPPDLVSAFVTPLYPEVALQHVFYFSKISDEQKSQNL